MLLPAAILASALTACPQPPAPQEPTQVETRALSAPRDIMLHGIVAGTSFNANQSLTLNNASVFANAGLVLNSRNLSLNGNLISSTSAATCTDNSGQGLCVKGKPKFVSALVSVPKPDVAALKTKYNTATSTTVQSSLTLNSSVDIGTKFDNQTILVKGSVNLNALGTIKNALIVVSESFKSNKGLILENTRIIAKEAQFNQTTTLNNSRILTDEDLTFNSKLESNGLSSVITAKNFTSNGTGMTSSSGELAVIANQNVTLNQASSGKLMLWAGNNITVNQSLNLEGAMVAGGKVVLNSSVSVSKVSSHKNPDVLGGGQLPYGTREEGILRDGGTWTSSFGVSITAPVGSLRKPELKIFVELVDPTKLEKPLPDGWELADQSVYRIGVVGGASTKGLNLFQMRLPLQNPNLNRDLFVFSLIPGYFKTDNNYPDKLDWEDDGLKNQQDNTSIITESGILLNEGFLVAIVKRKTQQINIRSAIQRQSVNEVIADCAPGRLAPEKCDVTLLPDLVNFFKIEYQNIDRIMEMKGTLAVKKIILLTDKGSCLTGETRGYFFSKTQNTYLCVDSTGKLVSNITQETIRHELFHGFQFTLLDAELYTKNQYYPKWNWILEGTATTSVESEIQTMDVQTDRSNRTVNQLLLSTNGTHAYKTQDFWVHSGKFKTFGLRALKPLFESGLLEPMTDLDKFFNDKNFNDNSNTGMRAAYWLWAKNQAYEKSIAIRSSETKCSLDFFATSPDSNQSNSRTYSMATTPEFKWTALANSTPEKGVAPLETRLLKVSLTDLENPKNLKLLALKVTNTDGTRLDKQVIRYKWYADPNPKGKPSCGIGEDTDVDDENKIKYRPEKFTRSLYVLISNVSIDKATSANRINLEDVKVTIEPIMPTMTTTSSTGGSSISLSGKVNEYTNTEQLKISNTGDLDSTLEFKQYFSSTNTIDASLLNPNSPVVAAAQNVQTRAVKVPPSIESSLFVAQGFKPNSSSENTLTKTKEIPEPSSFIDVNYYCSSAGTFNANVNVVYKTGAVDENGKDILELAVVPVTATCEVQKSPKVGAVSITPSSQLVKVGDYAKVEITVSNVGNAPLSVSVDGNYSMIQPGSEAIIVDSIYCSAVKKINNLDFRSNDSSKLYVQLKTLISCYYMNEIRNLWIFWFEKYDCDYVDPDCLYADGRPSIYIYNRTSPISVFKNPNVAIDDFPVIGNYIFDENVLRIKGFTGGITSLYRKYEEYFQVPDYSGEYYYEIYRPLMVQAIAQKYSRRKDFFDSAASDWISALNKKFVKNITTKVVEFAGDYESYQVSFDIEIYPEN